MAAGAVAKKLLHEAHGVRIQGFVEQVGPLVARIDDPASVTLEQVESNIVRCPDPAVAEQMIALIEQLRHKQDSIGGIAQIVASNVPAGWGDPVFDKLKADLGKAMFSLPAVLGVEYGAGFAVATSRGSENNDVFTSVDQDGGRRIVTKSNRHGGILGGISSGMPILVRCAVKPTSSLPREQPTITRQGADTTITTRGRHDPCLLPRFVPMAEAMMALVLADHSLRSRYQRA